MGTEKSKKFSEQYKKLAELVNKIENSTEEDIDELSDNVKNALLIADECEERIKKIKDSLNEQFKKE